MNEVLKLSGRAQARLIRDRGISSVELIAAHLARIDDVNPALNAVVEVLRESALESARKSDLEKRGRPLEGVPFSVKDSIEVEGTVCTAGTLGYRDNPPSRRDATLVARLRSAGAIPIARTNLPDLLFAFESDNLIYGRTNNPHDLSRSSGGSSGGEAALIAACGSPFGLGSDAAGSVRLPAHYCGIASIKPTSGRLPRTGHVPPAGGWIEMIWQIGPMARRVEDLVLMLQLLVGADGEDLSVVSMPFDSGPRHTPLRIAFFTDNGILAADAATAETVARAAKALVAEGFYVEEMRPPGIEQSYDLEMRLLGADGGDGLRIFVKAIGNHPTHPLLEGWLGKLASCRMDLTQFAAFWSELDRFRAAMYTFLNRFDAILSPVAAFPAVHHGHSTDDTIFPGYSYTMTHNMTGWPAAAIPYGTSPEGLPIGVQIAGAPWREDLVLGIAALLEKSQTVNQAGDIPRPEPVIDIHDRHVA
ncbi:MAG: amidase [Acidobacteriota bacterium]|nr:amidase [Acidobacteriota bacterium]